jgi:hypothetical protein
MERSPFRIREPALTDHFRVVGADIGGYYVALSGYARNTFGPYLGWSCASRSELANVIARLAGELNDLLRQVDQSVDAGILGLRGTPRIQYDDPRNHSGLALRFAILKRDSYRCQICGRNAQEHGVVLEIDHRIPRAKGGTDDPANLWTLCFDCNRGKSDSDL